MAQIALPNASLSMPPLHVDVSPPASPRGQKPSENKMSERAQSILMGSPPSSLVSSPVAASPSAFRFSQTPVQSPYDSEKDLTIDGETFERYEDPVVDECGHTFERAFIMQYAKERFNGSNIIRCPRSNQDIRLDQLRPNLLVKKASFSTGKLVTQLKDMQVRIKALESVKDQMQELMDVMKNPHANHQFVHITGQQMISVQEVERLREDSRQLRNMREMSTMDRILNVISLPFVLLGFTDHLLTVQQRIK